MKRTMYIAQLPLEKQDRIEEALKEFYQKEMNISDEEEIRSLISEVMCDKIWVLEEGFSNLLKELEI